MGRPGLGATLAACAVVAAAAAAGGGCARTPVVRGVREVPAQSDEPAKFHLRDGRLLLLDHWAVGRDVVTGRGAEYDLDRVEVRRGEFRAPVRDVVLVETTESGASAATGGIVAMSVVTGVSLVVTAACISAPKACFGSCPTFYVRTPREAAATATTTATTNRGDASTTGWALQAEGFSTSIARALEADDLDELPDARPDADNALELAMRNEALETHAVRALALRVVDGPAGSEVHARAGGPGAGFSAVRADAGGPVACEGAIDAAGCAALAARDAAEFTPGSDGEDLASRAAFVLRYPAPRARALGLVLTARNSLMSTYVFYHLLALHGRRMGDFIARLERRDEPTLRAVAAFDLALGGVDVEVRQGGAPWRFAGTVAYIGPIARGTRVVPVDVDDPDAPVEVRVTAARAHWRFDAARLGVRTADALAAVDVLPEVLDAGGRGRDAAVVARSVRGEGAHLVTLPGDELRFRFALPPAAAGAAADAPAARAYFLRSRGYYYEWMRREWLREEDVPRATALLSDARRTLRELAAEYRRIEPSIDALFTASRFAPPAGRRAP